MHRRRLASAALAGASLLGALGSTVGSSAVAAGSPMTATAATVRSSPTLGVRFFGSDAADTFVLSRAGTPAAPLVVFDIARPITIGANCRPAVGDPTTALCAAPIEAGSVLRRIFISSGGGDDVIAHAASLTIPLDADTGPGNDMVNGGSGMDLIAGASEDDLLRGGEGTDQIARSTGNDVLEGGPGYGDDLLTGNILPAEPGPTPTESATSSRATSDPTSACAAPPMRTPQAPAKPSSTGTDQQHTGETRVIRKTSAERTDYEQPCSVS